MNPRVIRFLLTPGEAWFRAVAWLAGSQMVVLDGAATKPSVRVDMKRDRTLMRVTIMPGPSALLDKSEALAIGRGIVDAAEEMVDEGSDGRDG